MVVFCCYSSDRIRKEIDIPQKVTTNENKKIKSERCVLFKSTRHNEEAQSHGTTLILEVCVEMCGCESSRHEMANNI